MKNGFEKVLRSTLKITCVDDFHNEISSGTGFLMLYTNQDPNDSNKHILLITNKHVLDTNTIKISFGIGGISHGLEPEQLHFHYFYDVLKHKIDHPNPVVDISLIPFGGAFSNLNRLNPQFTLINYSTLYAPDDWINVGTEVVYVGYPSGIMDTSHNLPLMRSGIISSYPNLDFNNEPKFIIDSHAFGGSSGSPVFAISRCPENIKLIGVVSAGYNLTGKSRL